MSTVALSQAAEEIQNVFFFFCQKQKSAASEGPAASVPSLIWWAIKPPDEDLSQDNEALFCQALQVCWWNVASYVLTTVGLLI